MKVMEKLLNAHKHRSMRMVAQFNQLLAKGTADTPAAIVASDSIASASAQVLEMLNDISNTRRFAQSLVVGMIEACKGIYDLFQQTTPTTTTAGSVPTSPVIDTSSEESIAAAEAKAAALQQAHDKDARQAYKELHAMISSVMGEYSKSMTTAFQQFFARYNAHFLSVAIDYSEYDEDRNSASEMRQSNSSAGAGSSNGSAEGETAAAQSAPTAATDDVDSEAQQALQVLRFKSSELLEERNNW